MVLNTRWQHLEAFRRAAEDFGVDSGRARLRNRSVAGLYPKDLATFSQTSASVPSYLMRSSSLRSGTRGRERGCWTTRPRSWSASST